MGIETALALGALALASAGTGYTIYASEEAKARQQKAIKEQQEGQKQLIGEQRTQAEKMQAEEESALATAASTSSRANARERQRRQAAGALGRADTILTSPLGLPGGTTAPKKTLLGL